MEGGELARNSSGVMNMLPPICGIVYSSHLSLLAEFLVQAAADNMWAASAQLHHLCGAGTDEVLDIAVTCDGMWSNRGFMATNGVVCW